MARNSIITNYLVTSSNKTTCNYVSVSVKSVHDQRLRYVIVTVLT